MQLANISLQLVVLLVIFVGWRLKKRGKFVWHGNLMLLAVFVVALMLISHMGPSLIGVEEDILTNISKVTPIIGFIHAVVGSGAIILGAWLVANWAYIQSSPNRYCASRKKRMRLILALWLTALLLGFMYYFFHSYSPA